MTTLGFGVDGSVMSIDTAYDSQGNAYLITSYDSATDTSSGHIVNQVMRLFNGFGQMTQEYQSASGAVVTSTTPSVQYTYSEAAGGANHSRRTSIVYPDGYTVNYNYGTSGSVSDTISQLTSLSDSTGTLESYTYLGLDNVVGRAHPQPCLNLVDTLDQFSRIADHQWTIGTTAVSDYQYLYDANNNVLSKNDAVNTGIGQVFTYDNLDQITSYQEGTLNSGRTAVTGTPSQSQSWSFDQLGNWNSVATNGTTQTRTANAQNEYTAVGSATPRYDNNGNMTTDATGLKFTYDAWNRVVTVSNSAGTTTLETFSYDGQDRRITITASGSTTNLLYSNQWQVLEESTGGSYTQRYVWSPVYVNAMVLRDSLVTTGPSPRYWVIQDGNWNVVAIVLSGSVVERYDYTPFGIVTVLNPDGTVRIGGTAYNSLYLFQGGRLDAVTGSYGFQERDYDPLLGRWRTVDPLGYGGGDQSLYRFVGNDLVNRVDPSGLEWVPTGRQTSVPPTPVLGPYGYRTRDVPNHLVYKYHWPKGALQDYMYVAPPPEGVFPNVKIWRPADFDFNENIVWPANAPPPPPRIFIELEWHQQCPPPQDIPYLVPAPRPAPRPVPRSDTWRDSLPSWQGVAVGAGVTALAVGAIASAPAWIPVAGAAAIFGVGSGVNSGGGS